MAAAGGRRTVACVVAALAVALVIGTGWLSVVGGAWEHRSGSLLLEVANMLSHLVWLVAGLLLVLRLPRNLIGWALLGSGVGLAVINLGVNAITFTHLIREQPSTLSEVLVVVGEAVIYPAAALGWLAIFLLYPDGRLPSPRWRWILWLAGATSAIVLAGTLLIRAPLYYLPTVDNPLGLFGTPALYRGMQIWGEIVLTGVGLPAAVVALVVRWRRGGVVQRQQIKWLLCAAAFLTLGIVLAIPWYFGPVAGDMEAVSDSAIGAASAAVPVAVLLAIARYRLFELDRIVSRSVSYAVVAGVLVAVYAALVLGVQTLIPASGSAAVAAATMGAAALFQPVRHRAQGRVDRVFNRSRYNARAELDGFSDRLRASVDLEDVAAEALGVATRTMHPASAWVWLRVPEGANEPEPGGERRSGTWCTR